MAMNTAASKVDPRMASLIEAFSSDSQVRYGGKGFGQGALKVNGKIFVMVSSRGELVVKLPRQRVAALASSGKGTYFEAGRKAIDAKRPPDELHAFRLKTKRFRYTLELFSPLYGAGMDRYLKALEANEEVVARNVTGNLFDRHIKPVFLGQSS